MQGLSISIQLPDPLWFWDVPQHWDPMQPGRGHRCHHVRKGGKFRVGDPTGSAQGERVCPDVPGPKLKGYHFVVVLKECLDTVSEIMTLLLQRGEMQCMSNK